MASKRKPQPGPAPTDSILTQARTLVLLWDQAEDWAIPRIPPSQLRVLTVLEREGSTNLTTLARELGAIPSSASRLCDRLEAAGLIERKTNAENKREVSLSVSKQGRMRLDAFAAVRRDDFARVLELMSPQAQSHLADGLRQFSDAAAQMRDVQAQEA